MLAAAARGLFLEVPILSTLCIMLSGQKDLFNPAKPGQTDCSSCTCSGMHGGVSMRSKSRPAFTMGGALDVCVCVCVCVCV